MKNEKISAAAKARYADKTKHPMYGKKHSEKAKTKMSKSRSLLTGDRSANWRGGKIIVGRYVYIHSPNHPHATKDRYVAEHRLIMEELLRRYLTPNEIVHHVDGDSFNNDVENLVLCNTVANHMDQHPRQRDTLGRYIKPGTIKIAPPKRG